MNAYDFDKTIFYPDSSFCFVLFCAGKYPAAAMRNSGRALSAAIKYKLGSIGIEQLKEALFGFLAYLPEGGEKAAELFWERRLPRIQEWYLSGKRDDDVIISASPEFLLTPVCRELGVRLIGTRMDPATGKITGKNCHDREKVLRFRERFGNEKIQRFYSDSFADLPMAELADEAFMVKKGTVGPWPEK